MNNIELLAPVGSMESLYAAIQNGANAVYLGGKLFNARQYASNFELHELKESVNYAHLRGVKVYVTVNILIDNNEIEEAIDYIRFLYEADVDAVIVQDLGLAKMIKEFFSELEIHASTQMTINNLYGVEFLEEMDFKRVVIARETPIDEIKHINKNTSIELETFIHGALCVSYSGQCLMSSVIGGRSGNRGNCAQPCRMPSSIIDKEGKLLNGWDKKHILSTKDLNTLEQLEKIIDSGVVSLKIEGRMKRPEYVATVVNNYRKALDDGFNSLRDEEKGDVEQIFNRGFTKGAMLGDFGERFISIDRPDNRGLVIGHVDRVDKYKAYVLLENDLEVGDGIEFELSSGERKGIRSTSSGKKGDIISFEKMGYILKDTKVNKTSSVKLLEKAKTSYSKENIIYPIDVEINIAMGKLPELIMKYKDIEVRILGDKETELAKKNGLDNEKVSEQLSKLGDTNYEINKIKCNIEDNSFLPLSILNKMRRDATDKLDKLVAYTNDRKPLDDEAYKIKKQRFFKYSPIIKNSKNKISIKVSNKKQLDELDINKVDRIYLGYTDKLEESISKVKEHGKEIYLFTNKIMYEEQLKSISEKIKTIENQLDGVSVSNLGTLKYIKDRFDLKIHGDIGLNAFNSYTLDLLGDSGLETISLSSELTLNQIKKMMQHTNAKTEALVYGHLPVMTTKHCPMALVKGCTDDKNCSSCNFREGYRIKDRMNVEFPMERSDGFSTIYNFAPLMVLDNLKEIYESGVDIARLDFTIEKDNIRYIQGVFYDYAKDIINDDIAKKIITEYRVDHNITKGHYFRGIM